MDNKKNFFILLAVLVVFIGAAAFGYNFLIQNNTPEMFESAAAESSAEKSAPEQSEVSDAPDTSEAIPAPDFTVVDKNGEQVTLSSKKGKPVVVNFWASWCGPCKMEMPDFDAAYEKYGDEVEFMMVNLTDGQRETVDKAAEFIEESGYRFPVYFDTESEAAYTYQTVSIPRTLFVDKDGNADVIYVGMISEEVLETQIEKLK